MNYIDLEETQDLIVQQDWERLASELAVRPVADAADVLVTLDDDQRRVLTKRLAREAGALVESVPYKRDPPFLEMAFSQSIRKRVGWLIVLMIGQMGTATVLEHFDNTLEQALVLALFIPMIISCGGNSGSQAATLVIRAMAVGQVQLGDWLRVIYRESITGLAIGAILGVIAFIRIFIFSDRIGEFWLQVGLTISLSTAAVVLTGSILGSILPLVLRALRADPATSSAPFVATLADVGGLIIYFLIAISLLEGKLL